MEISFVKIQTFYPTLFCQKYIYNYIWILIDILHKWLLKVLLSESFRHV